MTISWMERVKFSAKVNRAHASPVTIVTKPPQEQLGLVANRGGKTNQQLAVDCANGTTKQRARSWRMMPSEIELMVRYLLSDNCFCPDAPNIHFPFLLVHTW